MAWTENEWKRAMRRAGWRSIGNGAYRHKDTGAIFNAWNVTKTRMDKYGGHGEAWYEFALNEQTPTEAPF